MGEYDTNELSVVFLAELFEEKGCAFNTARLIRVQYGDIFLKNGELAMQANVIFKNDDVMYELQYWKEIKSGRSIFDAYLDRGVTLIPCHIVDFDEENYTFKNRMK